MLEQKVHLLFGPGKLAELGPLVAGKGCKKALVVCDPGIVAAGITDKVCRVLSASGVDSVVYDKVNPEPSHTVPDEGIGFFNAQGCDVVIGVGGGSSMDCAKSINLLRYNEGPILRFAGPNVPMNFSPGLFLVATTAGTGSEVSDGLVMSSDGHMKHGCLAVNAMAEYAIVDPELMVTMPPVLTAATGLDAFSHACEGYTTNIATPATDHLVEAVMRTVAEWLPAAVADGKNVEARTHMAIASTLGGWMLVQAHTNAGHSVAHLIGSYFGIPHGEGPVPTPPPGFWSSTPPPCRKRSAGLDCCWAPPSPDRRHQRRSEPKPGTPSSTSGMKCSSSRLPPAMPRTDPFSRLWLRELWRRCSRCSSPAP